MRSRSAALFVRPPSRRLIALATGSALLGGALLTSSPASASAPRVTVAPAAAGCGLALTATGFASRVQQAQVRVTSAGHPVPVQREGRWAFDGAPTGAVTTTLDLLGTPGGSLLEVQVLVAGVPVTEVSVPRCG
ncbi:MAG: hypothetical protein JWN57_445, partial [Frankiales bacterium]|nr:hypothetical protein [Frankiales bacterium]